MAVATTPDIEHLPAEEVLAYAVDRWHPRLYVACSFQKEASVIMDMLLRIEPEARFFTLDTGVLFEETYETKRALEERYGIEVDVYRGISLRRQAELHGDELWNRDPDACCDIRKVTPLQEALSDVDAWIAGLRRDQSPTRAGTPKLLWAELHARGFKVEVLDGDVVRTNLSKGLGFSKEDRDTNIRRIAFVADLLSRNGVVAITAAISPYREIRDEARELMGDRFIEIYVKASVEECARRDVKGLYEKAMRGELKEFTGVSDPYEEPLDPELVCDTETESPEESAAKVIAFLEARVKVPA